MYCFVMFHFTMYCTDFAMFPLIYHFKTPGLGGSAKALKILLSPEDLISTTTSRDDVVALVNILWKLSDSLEARHVWCIGSADWKLDP
jgi:hypothetical protein